VDEAWHTLHLHLRCSRQGMAHFATLFTVDEAWHTLQLPLRCSRRGVVAHTLQLRSWCNGTEVKYGTGVKTVQIQKTVLK
jgi:hypothetical protein